MKPNALYSVSYIDLENTTSKYDNGDGLAIEWNTKIINANSKYF